MRTAKPATALLSTILALWSSAAFAAGPGSEAPGPLRWSPAAVGLRGAGVAALALEPGTDRLAIGDEQGALIGRPGQAFRRVLHRGPVLDLVFLPDGALLAATPRGLYRTAAGASSAAIAPGPGASARAVFRVAALPGVTAAATGDGLFVSGDTQVWQRLTGALPAGAAGAVALRARGDAVVCWAVVRGELWRVELRPAAGGFAAAAAAREIIPSADRDGGAVDIAVDLAEAAVAVVFPQALALRRGDAGDARWEIVRPELPPGGRALRLGRGAGRYWLATDRGLLEASRLAGPWRRTSPPAGTSAILAAAGADGAIFAAASDGVLAGRAAPSPAESATPAAGISPPASGPDAGSGSAPPEIPPDPAVAQVHRAALRYLGLERSRMEALRRGVRRRGWWPIVIVRGAAAWDHGENTDHDQAFVSGATHHLTDREFDRDDAYDVSLSLSWDLGDIAYEPESIDVSRETREVIELRDDVLDEITQLYFERRRVLAALRALPGPPAAERAGLRLRADELAAGIDAWTGGWFGRQVIALAPHHPVPSP